MKIVFIVNPKAGKGRGVDQLIDAIYDGAKAHGGGAWVYETKGEGDAERFAASYLKANQDEDLHLYVCGGDGTMNEVMNAVMSYQRVTGRRNVSVGLVPIGTGNDFCKNFGPRKAALNIAAQLNAEPMESDILCYEEMVDGEPRIRYCVNMFNIGFDCNVADKANDFRRFPLIPRSLAYLIAVFYCLIKKKGANIRVEVDGETIHEGKVLLNSIANGPYCGGGIKSNPTATIHDGIMDINVAKEMSRTSLVKILPQYMKGTHMQMKNVDKWLSVYTAKSATITPLEGSMRICTDGEISDSTGITITVQHNAFTFLKPRA